MNRIKQEKGVTFITTFIFMMTMSVMVAAFLDISTGEMRELKGRVDIGRTFWFAEAGLHKAEWMIITPVSQGGGGSDYLSNGTTENLDEGSYTYTVVKPTGSPKKRVITSVGTYEHHTYTVKQTFDLG